MLYKRCCSELIGTERSHPVCPSLPSTPSPESSFHRYKQVPCRGYWNGSHGDQIHQRIGERYALLAELPPDEWQSSSLNKSFAPHSSRRSRIQGDDSEDILSAGWAH